MSGFRGGFACIGRQCASSGRTCTRRFVALPVAACSQWAVCAEVRPLRQGAVCIVGPRPAHFVFRLLLRSRAGSQRRPWAGAMRGRAALAPTVDGPLDVSPVCRVREVARRAGPSRHKLRMSGGRCVACPVWCVGSGSARVRPGFGSGSARVFGPCSTPVRPEAGHACGIPVVGAGVVPPHSHSLGVPPCPAREEADLHVVKAGLLYRQERRDRTRRCAVRAASSCPVRQDPSASALPTPVRGWAGR